jgi:putative phosphonate metabolism protein
MILQPLVSKPTVTATRYALYLVPSRDSLLWETGCRWLGRDPETGLQDSQPDVPRYQAQRIGQLTRSPRQYGFHATLKAPFMLAEGVDERQLMTQVAQLARSLPALVLPALQVDTISGFIALRPTGAAAQLAALEQRCVSALDALRAPLDAAERARRLGAGLTAHQKDLLERWGYPFVLDEYRFHMTLTQQLDDQDTALLLPWLRNLFAPALAVGTNQAELAVFQQSRPQADFLLQRRFPLGA